MKQTLFFSRVKSIGNQLKKFFQDVMQGRVKIDVFSLS